MRRVTVHDEKNWAIGVMEHPLKELNELLSVHATFKGHEAELAPRTDRGGNVEPETLPGGRDNRRLSSRCPRGSGVEVRTDTRLILEEDGSSLPFRQGADLRELLLEPAVDPLRILLVGTTQGALWRQPQLLQETSHRYVAEPHLASPANDLADHSAGPQRKLELELKRILLGHRIVNPAKLFSVELRGTPRRPAGSKSLLTALAISREPLVDHRATESERSNDLLGALSLLDAHHRLDPNIFECFAPNLASISSLHE